MEHFKEKGIQWLKVFSLALILSFAVSYARAATWYQPTATPPACPDGTLGCAAPIYNYARNPSNATQKGLQTIDSSIIMSGVFYPDAIRVGTAVINDANPNIPFESTGAIRIRNYTGACSSNANSNSEGIVRYDKNTHRLYYCDGSHWVAL